ncbi:MAG: hypothetical protein ACR2M1_04270 [Gemmatimonadaceae bacterium]
MAREGIFKRIFGRRPAQEDAAEELETMSLAEEHARSDSPNFGRPGTEPLAVVIPPDHVSLRLLRAHVRKWDWMAKSQDALRLTSGDMSLFDYVLAQRQRNARHRLIERADKGDAITEDDLIDVMGADFNMSGPEIGMILDADRDARRVRERAEDRSHWEKAIDGRDGRSGKGGGSGDGGGGSGPSPGGAGRGGSDRPDRGGGPGSPTRGREAETIPDARIRADDIGSLIFAAESVTSDSATSLTDWLNDDPAGLVRSLRGDATLAHAEARGEVLYEATVCAWARTSVDAVSIIEADLPPAVRRWLADDVALRAAEGDKDVLDAYFTDGARESEALHRAAWIDAISQTDGRAAAAALRPMPSVTTAAKMGDPAVKPGEFKRLDTQDAVSSLHRSIRSLRRPTVGDVDGSATPSTDRRSPRSSPTDLPEERVAGVGPGFDSPPIPEMEPEWGAGVDGPELDVSAFANSDLELPTAWEPDLDTRSEIEPGADLDAIWNDPTPIAPLVPGPAPKPRAPKNPLSRNQSHSYARSTDDLTALPQSADEAPGAAVWVRGRRVDGAFVQVKDDMVTVKVGEFAKTVNGPLHRSGGPAVIEPDGTRRYYVNGALSREDGPAIEAVDPVHDVYAVNGAIKPLDLPPVLMSNRPFRAQLFRAWDRSGFPVNAELQARALLAVMTPADREPILDALRTSSDKHDQRFAGSAEALYGMYAPTASAPDREGSPSEIGVDGRSDSSGPLPMPLPPSLGPNVEDDFNSFYESLGRSDDIEPSL